MCLMLPVQCLSPINAALQSVDLSCHMSSPLIFPPFPSNPAQLYIENGVARTILLKPILQDFEVAKRKMVSFMRLYLQH